jgi:hypothetical protein
MFSHWGAGLMIATAFANALDSAVGAGDEFNALAPLRAAHLPGNSTTRPYLKQL